MIIVSLIVFAFSVAGCGPSVTETAVETVSDKPAAVKSETLTEKSSKEKVPAEPNGYEVTVYKSPTCGCCSLWEDHLVKNGFKVTPKPVDDMKKIKAEYNVPEQLGSCHTAIVDGYIVEGHVPADDVIKMLKDKPEIVGLTAPGMPQKSPGMQPEGLEPKGYDVLSFDKEGKTEVYTSYKK